MGTSATLEAELFRTLVELLGDQKLERNTLRILVGARELELGRPYRHLCEQGLIAEQRVRPGFFRRFFGAQDVLWVQVTAQGRKVAAELTQGESDLVEPTQVEIEAPPKAIEPVAPSAPPSVEPVADLQEAPPPAKRKKPAAPPRFTPSDFTETLGGAPLETRFQIPDSDRLDGLTESVGLFGFDLTEAGKLLAVNRWAQGQTDTQVALEIVTTALAHAVRLDASGTTTLDRETALGLADRIREAFAVFVSEGLLGAEDLTEAADQMTRFIAEPTPASGLDAYLLDALRGMAPPAICPEGIYLQTEFTED